MKQLFVLSFLCCRTEERAAGWIRLTREILKLPEAPSVSSKGSQLKDALPPKPSSEKPASKARRPQPLIKLVMRRFMECYILSPKYISKFSLFVNCNSSLLTCFFFPLLFSFFFFHFKDWRALSVVSLALCFMQLQELFWKWEKAGQQHMH